jgi:F-type H+-transporting ATPase subunit alpha
MTESLNTKIADLNKHIEVNFSEGWFKDQLQEVLEADSSSFFADSLIKSEVSRVLSQIGAISVEFEHKVAIRAVGTVQHIGNGVANVSGLPQAGINELVKFPTGIHGLVLNLDKDSIDVILLGTEEGIHGGDLVTSTQERITIPVGPDLIGRVLNPLAVPLDEQPPIRAVDYHHVDIIAPGIIERAPVNEPLHTGIKTIDALFPIGRGQRELIIGDRQTGKTSLAVDAILSQKDANVVCIYVSIGQKKSSVLSVIDTLKTHNALEYTAVITSNPDDPPALRYLAPFSGCTMAEFFLNQGQDVLIIYDDLSKHADAYRELSLLLRRPPGREAYPGDIFYLHSRLLERACKLDKKYGGGSLTALPIMTMQQGNISAYIPTNLISICDGQIVLNTEKFNRGFKPAIHIGLSVSRVGGAAQIPAMRSVSNELKLDLSQYEEVERFTQFGTEVDETTKRQIHRGQLLQNLLNQVENHPLKISEQVVILYAANKGYMDDIEVSMEQVDEFENSLLNWIRTNHSGILNDIAREKELSKEIESHLKTLLKDFKKTWQAGAPTNG